MVVHKVHVLLITSLLQEILKIGLFMNLAEFKTGKKERDPNVSLGMQIDKAAFISMFDF